MQFKPIGIEKSSSRRTKSKNLKYSLYEWTETKFQLHGSTCQSFKSNGHRIFYVPILVIVQRFRMSVFPCWPEILEFHHYYDFLNNYRIKKLTEVVFIAVISKAVLYIERLKHNKTSNRKSYK